MLSKKTMNKIDELIYYLADNHLKMAKDDGLYWSEDLQKFGELLKNLAAIQTPVMLNPNITVTNDDFDAERFVNQVRQQFEQRTKRGKSSDLR